MKTWTIVEGKLTKDFDFNDFDEAVSFVNMIADVAEENNHHPEILLHSYNKLKIMLYTHSSKSLTQKDYDLAQGIDNIGVRESKKK